MHLIDYPAEPFRVKSVEPVKMLPRKKRERVIKESGIKKSGSIRNDCRPIDRAAA
jgi:tryptophanase